MSAESSGGLLRRIVRRNQQWSRQFDEKVLPERWRVDGLRHYHEELIPSMVEKADVIADIGGGKIPFVGTVVPKRQGQYVVGIDIDQAELDRAPAGLYDETIVADIGSETFTAPRKKADLVICQVVLEHVENNRKAIENIVQTVKPGGTITLFVPSRNALFARINLLLPEKLKRKLLFGIFPEMMHGQGFPAYYHLCTARDMMRLLEDQECRIERTDSYYQGNYFSFFVPVHVLWRLYQTIGYLVIGERAADYYYVQAVRRDEVKS